MKAIVPIKNAANDCKGCVFNKSCEKLEYVQGGTDIIQHIQTELGFPEGCWNVVFQVKEIPDEAKIRTSLEASWQEGWDLSAEGQNAECCSWLTAGEVTAWQKMDVEKVYNKFYTEI